MHLHYNEKIGYRVSQIGDIPDAEMKPPDNVLFVCKLNPVTEVSHSFPSHSVLFFFLGQGIFQRVL